MDCVSDNRMIRNRSVKAPGRIVAGIDHKLRPDPNGPFREDMEEALYRAARGEAIRDLCDHFGICRAALMDRIFYIARALDDWSVRYRQKPRPDPRKHEGTFPRWLLTFRVQLLDRLTEVRAARGCPEPIVPKPWTRPLAVARPGPGEKYSG